MKVQDSTGKLFDVFSSLTKEQPRKVILLKRDHDTQDAEVIATQGALGSSHIGWHKLGVGDWSTVDDVLNHYQLTESV